MVFAGHPRSKVRFCASRRGKTIIMFSNVTGNVYVCPSKCIWCDVCLLRWDGFAFMSDPAGIRLRQGYGGQAHLSPSGNGSDSRLNRGRGGYVSSPSRASANPLPFLFGGCLDTPAGSPDNIFGLLWRDAFAPRSGVSCGAIGLRTRMRGALILRIIARRPKKGRR